MGCGRDAMSCAMPAVARLRPKIAPAPNTSPASAAIAALMNIPPPTVSVSATVSASSSARPARNPERSGRGGPGQRLRILAMGKAQQMAFDDAADLVDGLGAVRGHAE